MDKAEIIKLLREYKSIKPKIDALNLEMSYANRLKYTLKASTISDMPTSHNVSNPVLDVLCRYETMIENYAKQILELQDKKDFIDNMINSLDILQREVIMRRYITNPDVRCDIFDWIGCQINYTDRQVRNIFNSAIQKLMLYKS